MSLSLLIAGAAASSQGKKSGTLHWIIGLGAPGVFGIAIVDASIIPLAIPGSTDLLLLWLIAQFFSGVAGLAGNTSNFGWAHAGGFASGLVLAPILRKWQHRSL